MAVLKKGQKNSDFCIVTHPECPQSPYVDELDRWQRRETA